MTKHHVRNAAWGIIDFDESKGLVFVQQRWLYDWRLWRGVTRAWTQEEKQQFHSTVDKQIWGGWSNKLHLAISGAAAAALPVHRVRLSFDVKWTVTPPYHWTVIAWKMSAAAMLENPHRSSVDETTKVIELNTADLGPGPAVNEAGASTNKFRTVPHEFGHAMTRGGFTVNPDEYVSTSRYLSDTYSIMNIGRQIRRRHVSAVIMELNSMRHDLHFGISTPVR